MTSLAVIGIAAAFADMPDVPSLERAFYIGEPHLGQPPAAISATDLAEKALVDAGIERGSAIAVLCVGSDQGAAIARIWGSPIQGRTMSENTRLSELLMIASDLVPPSEVAVLVAVAPRGGAAFVLTVPEMADGRDYAEVEYALQPPQGCRYAEISSLDRPPPLPGDCALGSIQGLLGNLGHTERVAQLLRTILAIHGRYVPAAGGSSPDGRWFTPPHSYPWFTPAGRSRFAWIPEDGGGGILVRDQPTGPSRPQPKYVPVQPLSIATASGDSCRQLLRALDALEGHLETPGTALAGGTGQFTVALLGSTPEDLLRELRSARRGVSAAFDAHGDWQTPRGSYFTARPVGPDGAIAFVYPGAFSSYPGMSRDLFRSFPQAYAALAARTSDPGSSFAETLVYPRSSRPLSSAEIAAYENRLHADPVAMIECGMACSVAYTSILRDVLGIVPAAAFGYSLGEMSMLWGLGAWTDGDEGRQRFRSSPLFQTRLAGPRQAVRDYRKAAGYTDDPDQVWATYTLLAPVAEVERAASRFDLVFLTVINGPEEVLIGGDPAQCEAAADALGCERVRMAFDYPIHCPVIQPEMPSLVEVNRYRWQPLDGLRLYSAAGYEPLPPDGGAVPESIARAICHQFDFPALVRRVYADGARTFVEVGPSATCSRLIDGILGDLPHLAVATDRRGAGAEQSFYRLTARLLSHGVKFNQTWMDRGRLAHAAS